jgi:hypothetical protein
MTVVVILDKWSYIGLAKDYKSALFYLYNNKWIEGSDEVRIGERANPEYGRLDEALGEDWFEKMLKWDIEDFNDYWDGSFVLMEMEVYDVS